MSQKSNYS